jgi:hypothetical protein
MAFITILVSTAAGLIYVLTHLFSFAQDGHSAVRRFSWSRKNKRRLIDDLQSPREAASILAVQIAAYEGALTNEQHNNILSQLQWVFVCDRARAEELYGFGRLVIGEINDAGNQLAKIMAPILADCSPDEQRDLVEMLEEIAEIGAPPSDVQRALIAAVRRKLTIA